MMTSFSELDAIVPDVPLDEDWDYIKHVFLNGDHAYSEIFWTDDPFMSEYSISEFDTIKITNHTP